MEGGIAGILVSRVLGKSLRQCSLKKTSLPSHVMSISQCELVIFYPEMINCVAESLVMITVTFAIVIANNTEGEYFDSRITILPITIAI